MHTSSGVGAAEFLFVYGAIALSSIFPHFRFVFECSLKKDIRRIQSDGSNTATTEPLLYCLHSGDLRPNFERVDSNTNQVVCAQAVDASVVMMIRNDPQWSGSAQA